MDEKLNLIKREIWTANKILILSHQRPDGDAIGSLLGFGLALQKAGKDVQMVLADGVPPNFNHLPGSNQINKRVRKDFDISVVLDCSDLERVGVEFDEDFKPTINIDHHITNLNFAQINLVDLSAPATAEILTEILPKLNLTITKQIADALLTGLITDTLGFRTYNMHPQTFRIAATLMEKGSDLPGLYQKALLDRSYKAIRYWGAGLSTLEIEDKIIWTCLTMEDRKKIGYPGRDDADLINILSSINDINIALIFVEQPTGSVKVSWRAVPGIDVSKIAFNFGGGGHKPAAGAEIEGELEIVKRDVLEATRNFVKNLKVD